MPVLPAASPPPPAGETPERVSQRLLVARLAAALARVQTRLVAIEPVVMALMKRSPDPDAVRVLQEYDRALQEIDACAGVCRRVAEALREEDVEAERVVGPVTLDDLKAELLGRPKHGTDGSGEADFF